MGPSEEAKRLEQDIIRWGEERIRKLEALSKPRDKLIIPVKFVVRYVRKYQNESVLGVSPEDDSIITREVKINTRSVDIDAEHKIIADIHKYDVRNGRSTGRIVRGYLDHQLVYLPRNFKPKEETSRIVKLGPKGGVLRIYCGDVEDIAPRWVF